MPREDSPIILPKNAKEELRVYRSHFRGAENFHIRNFAVYGAVPEPRPTREGVCLKIERLPELIEALQKLQANGEGDDA